MQHKLTDPRQKEVNEPSSDVILEQIRIGNEIDWSRNELEDDEVDDWDNFSNDDYFD